MYVILFIVLAVTFMYRAKYKNLKRNLTTLIKRDSLSRRKFNAVDVEFIEL